MHLKQTLRSLLYVCLSAVRQDPRARVIDRNGVDDAFEKDARAVPKYRDLMRSTGAQEVFVRPDGSIEFHLHINVLKSQHGNQLALGTLRKAASLHEISGITIRAKQAVPQRNVAKIVPVNIEFVMDRM